MGKGTSEERFGDDAMFGLPKTRVFVYPDRVVRLDENGVTMLEFRLASVQTVEFRRPLSMIGVLIFLFAATLAVVASVMDLSTNFRAVLYIGSALSAIIGAIGLRGDQVLFHSKAGDYEILCMEGAAEAKSFVVNVREVLSRPDQQR